MQKKDSDLGIICPKCHEPNLSEVLDSRPSVATTRRRRRCLCGYRFTTYELTTTQYESFRLLMSLEDDLNALLARTKDIVNNIRNLEIISEERTHRMFIDREVNRLRPERGRGKR